MQAINLNETELIFKLVRFIGSSSIDGISPSSIAKNLSITHYKASQYLQLLEQAFVLTQVLPKGTNVLKEPKVLLNVPFRLLYSDYEDVIGGLREDFVINNLKQTVTSFKYLKNKRGAKTPDYLISFDKNKIIIEVGGPSKDLKQLKKEASTQECFVLKDGAPYNKQLRPMSALGLLF